MAGDGQVTLGGSFADARFDFDTLYNLAGPLAVADAAPGDTLRIEILSLEPGDWGWCLILPGMGLLPDDFPEGYVRTFELAGRETVAFAPGVEIPFSPFFGTMGNHPGEPKWALPFPPHRGGGNMDNRHLVAGATLWLPVHVPGASFSVGDAHACQGDGEVCVSALECPMRASLRFTLERRTTPGPSWRSPGALTPSSDTQGYHATSGISDDLMEGARGAVRAMIDWLAEEHGLARPDAYMLCSLAGDLKIHEVVDAGVFNVGMTMPLAVFTNANGNGR
ncbi:MAG: Acetamidase/Formamidase [uncultured Thermoleophilia bacterium]|uniref:Acetamidase/Formamidase n=1 Tax=uncultured Thermoleophilia bacterium TaxID=1497501 RepID=A0A6J4UE19_9ACTN|nr:MAG: Acetamidase/Formamidase [uncultured Thermoleophilia bacterium]